MHEKEITIYDIARRLKISSATVSRALGTNASVSRSTQQKILDVAEQLGYRKNHFAQNLRRLRSNTIGVIMPAINSYAAGILAVIEEIASLEGFNVVIGQSFDDVEKEKSVVNKMFSNRVDGLIVLVASNSFNLNHFESFINKKIPVYLLDTELKQAIRLLNTLSQSVVAK